jgi:biopolymer transport protein TolQ
VSLGVLDLVLQASLIVQLVLLGLITLSIMSWAVIAYKMRELRRAQQDSEAFLEVYHAGSLDEAYSAAKDLDHSPLAAVFLAAYNELRRLARSTGGPITLTEPHLLVLARNVTWSSSRENLRLERGFSFLATTGSAAPFIGLFGTVVGIINAFEEIGRAGSASLAVVAPGIAEALLATAIGLFAAIPAVIIYNQFTRSIARYRALTGDASAEVLRLVSRDLDRGRVAIERVKAAE